MERYMMLLKSFKRMHPELEQALRENFYCLPLGKGEILQSPGVLNNNLYFVEKGLLHIFGLKRRDKITMAFRWEDQFVITLKSVWGSKKRYDGIEALEDSILWCIPGDVVDDLLEKHARFNLQFNHILIRETIAIQNVFDCSQPVGGLENLKNLCSRFPQLVHRVPLSYLANLTEIPEKKLKHLLESPIALHTDLKRRRR
jgi:signal-transduction protein with cAMP-binding, CBS, and nucleotidyltransferase domain